ncbi:hypothetical protein AALO_G00269030, partial [Alosa alosa]
MTKSRYLCVIFSLNSFPHYPSSLLSPLLTIPPHYCLLSSPSLLITVSSLSPSLLSPHYPSSLLSPHYPSSLLSPLLIIPPHYCLL